MRKFPFIRIAVSLLLPLMLLLQATMQSGCANIVPPAGGPRDSLPPVLVKANPPSRSTNVGQNRIVLTFDEFVDLDNPQQNIIISPLQAHGVDATRKLNVVTVKLDSLEPNTTYTLDFGNTIKDVNESNIAKNFIYTFSTGKYIDSLEFSGRVVMAQTGETDSTLTVMLHTSKDDSAVYNGRPRYIAKLSGNGSFLFRNLSPGTYYVYAVDDKDGMYQYRSGTQAFAFRDSAVVVGAATRPVTLYAYVAEKPSGNGGGTTAPTPARGGGRGNAADKRLRFATNLRGGRQDLLDKFMFVFDTKLRSYDSSKIHISTDTSFIPVTTGFHWKLDSTGKMLSLENYTWKENTPYNIIIEKDFATDTLGQQLLKTDTLQFSTLSASDYGSLSIRFRNVNLANNPVVQFVQSGQLVQSYPLTSDNLTISRFNPGEYELRILNDTNKNGVWDPGDFFGKHKQPELVKSIPRKLAIKANWDNAFEIAL